MAEIPKHSTTGEYHIATSQPDVILRHDISDEELDMLCQSRSDLAFELILVSAGTALGALPSALPTLYRGVVLGGKFVETGSDLIQLLIFCCSVSVGASIWVVHNRRAGSSKNLRESIRQRTSRKGVASQ